MTQRPASRALTVLITGFGPFPGAPFNPTHALVRKLVRLRRPALADVRLIGHIFRTSYAAVDAELPALIARHKPDVALMFGLAARTHFVRIETSARNARSPLLADASGRLARQWSIVPGGPARLRGRAPFGPLLVATRATRTPVRLSRNAGRYLCNYAYWRAAEIATPAAPRVVQFVHVPQLAHTARPVAPTRRRSVTMPDLVRAGEAILRVLAAAARRR